MAKKSPQGEDSRNQLDEEAKQFANLIASNDEPPHNENWTNWINDRADQKTLVSCRRQIYGDKRLERTYLMTTQTRKTNTLRKPKPRDKDSILLT